MTIHHQILLFIACTMIWCTEYSLGQVSLVPRFPTVLESEGSVEICAVLDTASTGIVTAQIFTEDQGAVEQEDYVGINETLTFTPGQTQMCVSITIIQDGILEVTEGIFVRLESTDLGASVIGIISIGNSDRVTIGFQQSSVMTTEGQPAMICVEIVSGQSARTIDFRLQTSDGSAMSTGDYSGNTVSLMLTPGQPECMNRGTVDDSVIEAEEFFLVILTAIDPIDVAESQVTVFIEDNDGAVVSLETTEISVPEGNDSMTTQVLVCVVLFDDLDGLEREVQVLLETVPVEADESDYEPLANATLSIPSSTMQGESVCRSVTIIGDDIRESDETFMVTISLVNPLDSIMGLDTVTVTIENDGDVIVDCGDLDDPTNGMVSLTGTIEGSMATYTCNSGFVLVGDSMRICGSDAVWSPSEPICVRDCGVPPVPANGNTTFSSTLLGSEVNYSCDTGFNLIGNSTRVCQADGQYSGDEPTCERTEPPSTPAVQSDDDDTIAIAVGVTAGFIGVVALVVVIIVVILLIRRRRTYNKYVLPYRTYVKPYTVYGNQRRSDVVQDEEEEGEADADDIDAPGGGTEETPRTAEVEAHESEDTPASGYEHPEDTPASGYEYPEEPPSYEETQEAATGDDEPRKENLI